MEIEKATKVISLLADGINPITGEIFDDDSPYNHPTIIRALFTFLSNVRAPKKQNKLSVEEKQSLNIENGKPRNAGLAWTEELKTEVSKLFVQGKSIDELAQHFERTKGAITSELERQGIINKDEPVSAH